MLNLTQPPANSGEPVPAYRDIAAMHQQGRIVEARAGYQKIVAQNPQDGDAWFGLGTASAQLGQSIEAIVCFERAMAILGPRPQIHHNMAAAKSALGRIAEAETHYKEAIRLKPTYYEAYFNYANVKSLKNGGKVAQAVERHLTRPGLGDQDQIFLHFAAGKIYDDMGEWDKAFGHMDKGNRLRNMKADEGELRRYFTSLQDNFTQDVMEHYKGLGSKDSRIVLVVGMPRSGTTLVEQVIGSHSQARGAGELSALSNITRQVGEVMSSAQPYPHYVNELNGDVLQQAGKGYVDFLLKRVGDGAQRIVDKTPLNFRHLGIASLMLPNLRIVHCRRNPLDTCLSCYFQNFRTGHDYAFDLESLGIYYAHYSRLMEYWKAIGLPIYEVDYARFVQEPEDQFRALLDHLELDWEPQVMRYHEMQRDVQTASRAQVRRAPYTGSIGRAGAYRAHLQPLVDSLAREGISVD